MTQSHTALQQGRNLARTSVKTASDSTKFMECGLLEVILMLAADFAGRCYKSFVWANRLVERTESMYRSVPENSMFLSVPDFSKGQKRP